MAKRIIRPTIPTPSYAEVLHILETGGEIIARSQPARSMDAYRVAHLTVSAPNHAPGPMVGFHGLGDYRNLYYMPLAEIQIVEINSVCEERHRAYNAK